MEKNPFVIKSYESKELFCDREKELQLMVRNCTNGADMTLISQRRMGKTGLILRLFDELRELEPDLKTIYVDIYASRSLADFIKLLAEASLRAFPKKDSMGEKILGFLKSLRPQFSFDPITGDPQLQINYQTEQEKADDPLPQGYPEKETGCRHKNRHSRMNLHVPLMPDTEEDSCKGIAKAGSYRPCLPGTLCRLKSLPL